MAGAQRIRFQNGAASLNGNAVSEKAKAFQIFYDSNRQMFLAPNSRDGWIVITTQDVRRWLKERGCRSKAKGKGKVSEIDALLTVFQREFDVEYAGSLAGHRRGLYEVGGKRILVKDSPVLIEPSPGSWPLLQGIIRNMLGADQEVFLFGWLKIGFESLYSGKSRVGQALTLAGPRDCGKSLLQNLFTEILGGRSAKPHRYMSGVTPFNGELFCSEHLIVEDEEASTYIRARRNFGTKIKEITANVTNSYHAKHRQAITLNPFWRLSISVNDEPENLQILPPIDESLQDKLIILKAVRHPMPRASVSDAERESFMAALRAELPHFIDFLTKWQIPNHLISQRYGITHFHHPDILEALGTFAPETKLLEMIDAEMFDSVAPGIWEGSASLLERHLVSERSKVSREARQLFSFQSACGTYLGRLARINPERFSQTHTRTRTVWTISPPESE
jgi:Family of unknown function (DUF5906)